MLNVKILHKRLDELQKEREKITQEIEVAHKSAETQIILLSGAIAILEEVLKDSPADTPDSSTDDEGDTP